MVAPSIVLGSLAVDLRLTSCTLTNRVTPRSSTTEVIASSTPLWATPLFLAATTLLAVGAVSGTDNVVPSQIPLVSIRLSPSVDSSLSGGLGEREIINRMQLQLNSLDVVNTHECEIKLILNPSLSTDTYLDVAPPSLSQLIKHTVDDTYAGGLEIFSFRAAGGQTTPVSQRNRCYFVRY